MVADLDTDRQWTPEIEARTRAKIADDEVEAEREEMIADAFRDAAEEHYDRASICRRRAKVLRDILAEDGLDA